MRVGYSPRAIDKTARLIEWLAEKPNRILSHEEESLLSGTAMTLQLVLWIAEAISVDVCTVRRRKKFRRQRRPDLGKEIPSADFSDQCQ
jgi:hypothetical protein